MYFLSDFNTRHYLNQPNFLRILHHFCFNVLRSDEEAERTLLKEEERKSQQLYEEQVKLQQQIDELQSAELEVEV